MAIETQHVESLEDIVFKNRNKEYGSYYLRKKYRKFVIISMIAGFVLIGVVVAYPLINAYINKERLIREKEKETGNHIPIVAMTAYAMDSDRVRCLEAGMDAYVSKPINVQELFKTVESLVTEKTVTRWTA